VEKISLYKQWNTSKIEKSEVKVVFLVFFFACLLFLYFAVLASSLGPFALH
jgi:hypothetical protein